MCVIAALYTTSCLERKTRSNKPIDKPIRQAQGRKGPELIEGYTNTTNQ